MDKKKDGAASEGTAQRLVGKSGFRQKRVEDTDSGKIGTIVDETESCVGIVWPDAPSCVDYRQKSALEKA